MGGKQGRNSSSVWVYFLSWSQISMTSREHKITFVSAPTGLLLLSSLSLKSGVIPVIDVSSGNLLVQPQGI